MLKFNAWSTGEVIQNLNNLQSKLQAQAVWGEKVPGRLGLGDYALSQRFVPILRLYIPEAVRILETDPTLFRVNWWDGNWVDTYAAEHRAICILEHALRAANPTKSFA